MSVVMEKLPVSRTDDSLKEKVQKELDWDTHITAASAIGVAVNHGAVTLTGQVPTYAEKMAAQEAAHRVVGVHDVANDIAVAYAGRVESDTDIAQAVRRALEWDTLVPNQKIQSTVSNGWVTLAGTVSLWSQRNDAEAAIRNLVGVRGVINTITVSPSLSVPDPTAIRKAIEEAIDRQTESEVKKLGVAVNNGTVTLSGSVRTWREKVAATGAAGYAPGVRHVDNLLTVNPYV